MPSDYLIQVVTRRDGQVVESIKAWEPGLRVEREFVASLIEALSTRPIGLFRTKATVLAAVKAAVEQFLFELKSQV
jgi:hypothetical protein